MATKKKMLQAAAGNAGGGAGLDVESVFSTYLYEGTGAAQTITNGIDLDGEGGITWIKNRENSSADHSIYSTDIGDDKLLATNKTDALNTVNNSLSFTDSGFSLSATNIGYWNTNKSGEDYASWTFRKAPKFFTCLTYTGNSTAGRTVAHNLGSTPGVIIVKRLDSSNNWNIFHRSLGATKYLQFTAAAEATNSNRWNNTAPTDAVFTLGNHADVNSDGATYVAYLFAHNDGDGEFGPDGDADIIKCGSVVADGSGNATVDLGFEPQWLMVKNATSSGYDWQIFDTMRGFKASPDNDSPALFANTSGAESGQGDPNITSTGFTWDGGGAAPNNTYIFMAIRRGTKVPESGTEVFDIDTRTGSLPSYVSTFPVDMAIRKLTSVATNWNIGTRLTGTEELEPNTTVAAGSDNDFAWDYMEGYGDDGNAANSNLYSWMWKRAPGYFDAVTWSGNSTSGRTVSHNLGVAPEMMWVKVRSGYTASWIVYHSGLNVNGDNAPETDFIRLEDNRGAFDDGGAFWNSTAPTDSNFTVGSSVGVNGSSGTYIAYLFASLDGISKVGSYTGTGGTNTQVIDCGFTSGARFVLLKRSNASGYDWQVFDTERGITSGNDAKLALNTTAAQSTLNWGINPNSSGFEVTGNGLNETGGEWIFYAIA
jgi:hypothetical protein